MIEADHESWMNVNPQTVALMEDVKRAGYVLGILSNMPHDFLAMARKDLPVFSIPDVGVFSCEYNLIKPEMAIYGKLLELCGAEGQGVVFFDDKIENINGAAAAGIRAFLWEGNEIARRTLMSLGVKL